MTSTAGATGSNVLICAVWLLPVLTVETNGDYSRSGVHSKNFYTSFSLLKSLEAGFRLSCLNHACDSDVNVMSDLFGDGH